MSDLSEAQWREIEAAAVAGSIQLGKLRTIIKRSRRSLDQNALLWVLYTDALKQGGETLGGWTKEDVHEYMLGEWGGWDTMEAFGRKRLKPKRRSSRLGKSDFSDFLVFVVQRFAEHGIVLDLPDERAA